MYNASQAYRRQQAANTQSPCRTTQQQQLSPSAVEQSPKSNTAQAKSPPKQAAITSSMATGLLSTMTAARVS